MKTGRFSLSEQEFISANAEKMSAEDIAKKLNRDATSVTNWMHNKLGIKHIGDEIVHDVTAEIQNELRASPDWELLKQQFVESELVLFERKFGELMQQFRNDVLPTEKIQIFQLIKLDILMDRNLKSRARALADVERLEEIIADEYKQRKNKKNVSDDDRNRLAMLENQLMAAREAEGSKTNEYVKLSEKHGKLMEQMKATRDQRVSKADNAKQTFLGLLRAMQDSDIRAKESEDLELMNLAAEKETKRLGESHQYVDDNYDKPLLNEDTI